MIARAIFGLVIASLTTYIVWYEFGSDMFQQPVFMMLITLWAMYGVMLFFDRVEKAIEKTTNEKLDELTVTINKLTIEIKAQNEKIIQYLEILAGGKESGD